MSYSKSQQEYMKELLDDAFFLEGCGGEMWGKQLTSKT